MFVVAGLLLIGCVVLTLSILRRRVRWERPPELDEALERLREVTRRPVTLMAGATIVALVVLAALARNPSRWPLALLALVVLAAGTAVLVVIERRRSDGG